MTEKSDFEMALRTATKQLRAKFPECRLVIVMNEPNGESHLMVAPANSSEDMRRHVVRALLEMAMSDGGGPDDLVEMIEVVAGEMLEEQDAPVPDLN